MKNSPYVGWFRHAPPSDVPMYKVDPRALALLDKCRVLAMILGNIPRPELVRPDLASFISGRLLGGGKGAKCYDLATPYPHQYSHDNWSLAVNILSKLGGWFLSPVPYEPKALEYCTSNDLKILPGNNHGDDGSDSDSDSDNEDDDSCEDDESSVALSDFGGPESSSASALSASSLPVDISVSQIAEAYYAHQVIDQSEYSSLEGDRLDYVITQADIARMARNAARHLDVESILSLPTVTYRSPKQLASPQKRSVKDSRGPDEVWSFVMVPQESNKSTEPLEKQESDPVCVICLETFVDGDRLRVLPCDHSFHVGCIDRWLSGSHSHHECFTSGCPTCKKQLTVTPEAPQTSNSQKNGNDGWVPSWAFAHLGSQMAQSNSR